MHAAGDRWIWCTRFILFFSHNMISMCQYDSLLMQTTSWKSYITSPIRRIAFSRWYINLWSLISLRMMMKDRSILIWFGEIQNYFSIDDRLICTEKTLDLNSWLFWPRFLKLDCYGKKSRAARGKKRRQESGEAARKGNGFRPSRAASPISCRGGTLSWLVFSKLIRSFSLIFVHRRPLWPIRIWTIF